MKACRIFVPYGALGTGILEESFIRGVEMKPDAIVCDAGSTDSGVDSLCELCRELCREEKIQMKAAKIYCQQQPEKIKEKYRNHQIIPLEGAKPIDEQVFEKCTNIVGLAGAEAFF